MKKHKINMKLPLTEDGLKNALQEVLAAAIASKVPIDIILDHLACTKNAAIECTAKYELQKAIDRDIEKFRQEWKERMGK